MKNLRLLIILRSLFGTESFSGAILVFFYTKHVGISLSEYSFSLVICFLLCAALQIPAGMLSDQFGRRRVLVLAELAYAMAQVGLILCPTRWMFYATAVVFPVATAFSSGNFESLIFEAQAQRRWGADFKAWMKASANLSVLAGAIAAIIGGFLAEKNLALPLFLDAIIVIISAILALRVLPGGGGQGSRGMFQSMGEIFKVAIDFSRENRRFIPMTIVAALLFSCVRGLYTMYQPLLFERGFQISEVGLVIGGLSILSFLFVRKLPMLILGFGDAGHLELGAVCLMLFSALFVIVPGTVLPALLLQQVLRVFSQFYSKYFLNSLIPADHPSRVTLLSIAFFVNMVFCALVGILETFFLANWKVNLVFCGICILLAVLLIFAQKYKPMEVSCESR